MKNPHIPVMLEEVLSYVAPSSVVIDATFGAGGYTRALKEKDCRVIAFDKDPSVAQFNDGMCDLYHMSFTMIDKIIELNTIDTVVFDLGVSSMQLDEPARGFSFGKEGPLDMRMDTCAELTAAIVVNSFAKDKISEILRQYGEERLANKIATYIVCERQKKYISSTKELADIVCMAKKRTGPQHPATKTFQALRIFINNELNELNLGLKSAYNVLRSQGLIIAVTFHSLEARAVKVFMKEHNMDTIYKQNVSRQEAMSNKRARSAQIRIAQKI